MNIRLFFLKQDGWFEAELTEKLLHATAEDLIRWAYAMMERYNYRNYLITEKPNPLPAREAGTGEGMISLHESDELTSVGLRITRQNRKQMQEIHHS